MNATCRAVHALTAGDVMSRDLVVVPQHMSVREAARLLHRARVSAAPVVDERGRCVGSLSAADVFRWALAGCPETVVDPVRTCPYQLRGRLLTGNEAVMCMLAHGSCPFQVVRPTTGGRHTDICMRPETEASPLGTVPRYMTTDVATVRLQTPLPELVRQLGDAHADRLIVLDEFDRPIGIVSAPDVLNAAVDGRRE